MRVRVLIDRPALPAALHALGLPLTDDPCAVVAIVRADALADAHCCPAARVLAVARDEAEELAALAAGADDAARGSDALVSLRAARLMVPPTTLTVGTLRLDRLSRTAARAGRALRLLPREYALLEMLARHAGTTVSHAALRREVFGLPFDPGTNLLAVHVSRVRRALDHGQARPMLLTDRGRGYRLIADGDLPCPAMNTTLLQVHATALG